MNIAVIGTGYVGLVTAACMADFGHFVIGIEKDQAKLSKLKSGEVPIYEIGLEEIIRRNRREGRLYFTNDMDLGIKEAQVVIIGVGTPSKDDGSVDLSQVEAVVCEVARNLNSYKVIVIKSTVPVGTSRYLKDLMAKNLRSQVRFDIASNPEFLREGSAVDDFMHPDRVIIGTESSQAESILKEIYRNRYLIETPFVLTSLENAELIKYAGNSFLATKISFINELANLCEEIGCDIQVVAKGMGLDRRIGSKFLHAGPGYGGSCFPKDTRALAYLAKNSGESLSIVNAVINANELQKQRMVSKIQRVLGDLKGKTLTILGLTFKPNTNDMREAPSINIVQGLLAAGAKLRVHDPIAEREARQVFGDTVEYFPDPYEAARNASGLIIITEWNSYRRLDLQRIKGLMKQPVMFDLRNIYTIEEAESVGFYYEGVGRMVLAKTQREVASVKEP